MSKQVVQTTEPKKRKTYRKRGTYSRDKASACILSRVPESMTRDGMSLAWLSRKW